MPTYLQLWQEPVWGDQYVPGMLNALLIQPLRSHFGLGPAAIGAPGDNNHLYGRHRSANWDRTSIYCTNRSYGTTDARDKRGDQNWYRAVDVGIKGQPLYDACHRLDTLVRAGNLPGLAEWFGTFDGKTVVGWYEGHPSSSDDSHLWHLHVGLWNGSANDETTMRILYDAITGEGDDMPLSEQDAQALIYREEAIINNRPEVAGGPTAGERNKLHDKLAELEAKLDALLEGGGPVLGSVDLSDKALADVEAIVDEQLDQLAD